MDLRSATGSERMSNVVRDVYMVLVNAGGAVFVKTLEYYRIQGGFREPWGEAWVPIVATSIEDARERGCALPGARPFYEQASEGEP